MKGIRKSIGAALLSVLLLFSFLLPPTMSKVARAETALSPQEKYEQTDVMKDLEGATIGGKQFDLQDYPHNGKGKPQIVSFVEFCYSYYEEKQNDYAFYVYVYNPQDAVFDTDTERNKIQLSAGKNGEYNKYPLEFVRYSETAGYEGRFYKFKVRLDDSERNMIWQSVEENKREYRVSGIELSIGKAAEEYGCQQVYTYSGFAHGYGSPLAINDTLSCTVDGLETYLTLDVQSTYYRPKGTHADGYTQDTLHSVYFSVPNEIIEEYGEMTAVHATWLNAYTAPMFVTGNKNIYDAILPYLGQYVDGSTIKEYENTLFPYAIIATKAVEGFRDDNEMALMAGYYAYNAYHDFGGNPSYDRYINHLNYLFYAGEGVDSADGYTLSAEAIIGDKKNGVKGWLETFTDKFGDSLINNRYSSALFEKVDEKFTDKTITGDEEYELKDLTLSSDPWRWWLGQDITQIDCEKYSTVNAIQKVTADDFTLYSDKGVFCEKFFVDESDYNDFKSYVKAATGRKETTYLFRYHLSEYVSNEATEYERTSTYYIFQGNVGTYKTVDTNAYFAQMWIQLDFDIIDLTFTKDNVDTIISVIMSPMDIAADATPPVSTQTDKKPLAWWQILLGAIALIVIIVLLIKFAPWLIYGLGKVIEMPFKAIFKACSSGRERRREKREKKRLERKLKKARKPMDKEFSDFDKRCKREEKEVQKNWKKVDVDALKKKIWSGEKSESELTKTERYALNQDEEWLIEQEIEDAMYGYDDEMDWWMT